MRVMKTAYLRSEAYRRRVAALPCANCGKPGPSQCAHSNRAANGKGGALKASDAATFPLCPDCHRWFDQGGTLSRREAEQLEKQWIAWTRRALEQTETEGT